MHQVCHWLRLGQFESFKDFIILRFRNGCEIILNCKLYYQQLHLTYFCNLATYWLLTPWRWESSVETCSSVIICEIIVHLLVHFTKLCQVFVPLFKSPPKPNIMGLMPNNMGPYWAVWPGAVRTQRRWRRYWSWARRSRPCVCAVSGGKCWLWSPSQGPAGWWRSCWSPVLGLCSGRCGHTTKCHTHCTHGPYFQGRVQGPADTPQTVTHITHTDPIFRVVFRVLRTHRKMSHKLHTHRPYFQGRVQGPADTPKTLTHITHTDPIFRVVFRALRTHYMSHTLQIKILVSGLCSGPGGHTTNCHTHYTHGPYFQGCVQGAADTPHITHIANTDPSFRVVFRALRTHQKLLHKLHTRNLFSGWCSGRCGHTTYHTYCKHRS